MQFSFVQLVLWDPIDRVVLCHRLVQRESSLGAKGMPVELKQQHHRCKGTLACHVQNESQLSSLFEPRFQTAHFIDRKHRIVPKMYGWCSKREQYTLRIINFNFP